MPYVSINLPACDPLKHLPHFQQSPKMTTISATGINVHCSNGVILSSLVLSGMVSFSYESSKVSIEEIVVVFTENEKNTLKLKQNEQEYKRHVGLMHMKLMTT